MNGKTSPVTLKSAPGSPTKRSVVPTSSAPTKQDAKASSAMPVSPTKRTKSMSVSQTKRKVASKGEDEERLEVDEPAQSPSDDDAEESEKHQGKSVRTPHTGIAAAASNKVYLMTMQATLGVDVVKRLRDLVRL